MVKSNGFKSFIFCPQVKKVWVAAIFDKNKLSIFRSTYFYDSKEAINLTTSSCVQNFIPLHIAFTTISQANINFWQTKTSVFPNLRPNCFCNMSKLHIFFKKRCKCYVTSELKRVFRSNAFLLGFLSNKFDRSKDLIYQVCAFCDLPFPRYNSSDFPLKRPFSFRNFATVAN